TRAHEWAPRRAVEPRDQAEQRGRAAARGADDREQRGGRDLRREPLQRANLAARRPEGLHGASAAVGDPRLPPRRRPPPPPPPPAPRPPPPAAWSLSGGPPPPPPPSVSPPFPAPSTQKPHHL